MHKVVDTSVLLVLLRAPGYFDEDRFKQVIEELGKGKTFLYLSLVAVIEAGNLIAQLSHGHLRRQCAERLNELVIEAIEGETLWRFLFFGAEHEIREYFEQKGTDFSNLAQQGIGMGDALIIESAHRLKDDLKTQGRGQDRVIIWTFDERMKSWSPDPV